MENFFKKMQAQDSRCVMLSESCNIEVRGAEDEWSYLQTSSKEPGFKKLRLFLAEWYRWIHRFLQNQKTNIDDHRSNQDIVNSNSNSFML